jgi:uncharacterized protein YaaR (DUF327 family)
MKEIPGRFLPFGLYFYFHARDNLEYFKDDLKNFLIFAIKKTITSDKIININATSLLDLYIPPLNVLVVLKVLGQNKEEKVSLEISNYPEEVIHLQENGLGFFVSEGEEILIEFYAIDDNSFSESIKKYKHVYKAEDMKKLVESVNSEINELLNNKGYELIFKLNVYFSEIAKKFIQIIDTFIIEEEEEEKEEGEEEEEA